MDIDKVLGEHNCVIPTKAKLAKLCHFQISAVLLHVLKHSEVSYRIWYVNIFIDTLYNCEMLLLSCGRVSQLL